MVRHKSRWLLVSVETEEHVKNLFISPPEKDASRPLHVIDKTALFHAIRITMQHAFGVSAAGIIEDIQVRLYNPETQLAMIKVPRDSSDIVRSAITLLTEVNDEPIVATVISTNGCPRTAKLAALRETKRIFQVTVAGKGATGKKELRNLEDQMDQIRNID